jgi:AcrR family transcriptional regulator
MDTDHRHGDEGDSVESRILHVAIELFLANGFAKTSTLEIATRAKVSKRDLYSLFGSKQAMLAACITHRVQRFRLAPALPPARDRDGLAASLIQFGTILLREICRPPVLAVFHLAIAEAKGSPEVAQTLEAIGRQPSRQALQTLLAQAQSAGLIEPGDVGNMAAQFSALLWEDLIIGLLLGVRPPPDLGEIDRRAAGAATAFLKLYGQSV